MSTKNAVRPILFHVLSYFDNVQFKFKHSNYLFELIIGAELHSDKVVGEQQLSALGQPGNMILKILIKSPSSWIGLFGVCIHVLAIPA